jgi:hypothetical protein
MTTYVVRVWLPDRPGALGAVASRIGAVRGDLVGIDILERGGGRVIDELAVELPGEGEDLVALLVREIAQVDGVDVEDVRPQLDVLVDPRLDALETAAALVAQPTQASLVEALARHGGHALEASWAVVLDDEGEVRAAAGVGMPSASWLDAFVAGTRSSAAVLAGECGPDDVACASLGAGAGALVLGRQGRPFRARERRQLAALARIAERRLAELAWQSARTTHPAAAVAVLGTSTTA